MKRISRSLGCAVLVLLPLAALAASPPQQGQSFTLTLEAPKQPLKAGRPQILRAIVKNTSDQLLRMPMPGWDLLDVFYQVHVLDAQGKPVPHRPPRRGPGGKGIVIRAGSAPSTSFEPGKSITEEVNVSDDYDLRPGKYKIWIAGPVGPRPSDGLVKSNVITVTVVK